MVCEHGTKNLVEVGGGDSGLCCCDDRVESLVQDKAGLMHSGQLLIGFEFYLS
ncbi:hypothetical protein GCM10022266_27300 [Agrococcus terreus]